MTNIADSGAGSLRDAINQANNEVANPGADTIRFAPYVFGQNFSLSTVGDTTVGPSALGITSDISINGFINYVTGTGVTISQSNATGMRLFYVSGSGTLTLTGVTLSGSSATGGKGGNAGVNGAGGGGGGAGLGGAIFNAGTLNVLQSTLTGNTATGGNGGDVTGDVTGDAGGGAGGGASGGAHGGFSGGFGSGGGGGGGVGNGGNGGFGGGGGGGGGDSYGGFGGFGGGRAGDYGDFDTPSGDYSFGGGGGGGAGMGGAIFNNGGTATITNSTITGNTAAGGGGGFGGQRFGGGGASAGTGMGGGIFNYNGRLVMLNSTVSGNVAAEAIYNLGDTTTAMAILYNTILAGGSGGSGFVGQGTNGGTNTSLGAGNLITNPSGFGGTSIDANPLLGTLANSGGPTMTMLPQPGSAAINTGLNNGLTLDQRNFGPRINGGTVDIGAVETGAMLPPPPKAVVNTLDGTGIVRVLNADGTTLTAFAAYAGYTGSVATASGDMVGDVNAEIVTGANGHVKVFNITSGVEVQSFFAFAGYQGGIQVAAADLTGDGIADIVVSADVNGHVKVFDGVTGAEVQSFFAFDGYNGPVAVAVSNAVGIGFNINILVVGANSGAGIHIKTFDPTLGVRLIDSFIVAGSDETRFSLATGDDAYSPFVVAQGVRVTVLDGLSPTVAGQFSAFDEAFLGLMGVQMVGDDIIAAAQDNGRLHVKKFDRHTFDLLDSFYVDERQVS